MGSSLGYSLDYARDDIARDDGVGSSLDYARDDIARDDSSGYSIWQRTTRPDDIRL